MCITPGSVCTRDYYATLLGWAGRPLGRSAAVGMVYTWPTPRETKQSKLGTINIQQQGSSYTTHTCLWQSQTPSGKVSWNAPEHRFGARQNRRKRSGAPKCQYLHWNGRSRAAMTLFQTAYNYYRLSLAIVTCRTLKALDHLGAHCAPPDPIVDEGEGLLRLPQEL